MSKLDTLQRHISEQAFAEEQASVQKMLGALETVQALSPAIFTRASALVTRIRENGHGSGVEAFLHTYGLDTREGIAVMCLAEALLRIPDSATADKLIENTFEHTEWGNYLGSSESFFVNASSWGLLLTGNVVNLGNTSQEKPSALIGKLIARMGEPVIREALKQSMRFIGSQFVLGETIEEALQKANIQEKKGYRFSYDMLGESARTLAQADGYVEAYHHAIAMIGKRNKVKDILAAPSISIKLSALHPRYHLVQEARVMKELLPRLIGIAERAMDAGISISIDAEESTRLDIELVIFRRLFSEPIFRNFEGIGFVLQAYQKRAVHVIDYLAELAIETKKRMPVRLVKGAYWDSEIKSAQVQGLPTYPVFTRKEHTDVSYMACAQKIIAHMDLFYPQFATHNALTVATIQELIGAKKDAFEFQRLHGMGAHLHDQVVSDVPCRIYAPVGRHKDLLAYLIRRLLENGANTSFVHSLMDRNTPLSELLEDPIEHAKVRKGIQNEMLPNPINLYNDRKNSSGFDLGNHITLAMLTEKISAFKDCFWHAEPTGSENHPKNPHAINEPANNTLVVGYVSEATQEQVIQSITRAKNAFVSWSKTTVAHRAEIIERYAALLEKNQFEAIALIMREAGKTLPDAIAEVREAIDFCHYYALQAHSHMAEKILEGPTGECNVLTVHPRGVFACISPWNFPLAIFTGQVVAALVTGNTVLAKPAEQTPLVAAFAVKLLHEANVPREALQLLPGDGETVGTALIKDTHIIGVVFTGSMETARVINRTLAARSGPIATLIAETGGQNCMIVDSSALLEQVTDDVITSAFGSTGQRCSALRVLYVQEEIAEPLIKLISGAMQELKIGRPFFDPAVDIGPVIDKEAQTNLIAHIKMAKVSAKFLAEAPISREATSQGTFVAPHMFEIDSITQLDREVFGPILHVIRYKQADLGKVCDEINSTGYGLTFGIQSRIEKNVEYIKDCIHAGNVYVNRSMIGATVGVQPFGGEGLSGTGPKAGGPSYLSRFVTERTYTVNTAAIGGNTELLSK